MLYNYLKKYKLTFENAVVSPDEELEELRQNSSIFLLDTDLTKTTILGTTVEDLHMEATLSMDTTTTSSNGNKAEIKVFNLPKEVVERISNVNGKVILEAGYEKGDFDTVFTGQIYDINTIKNGADLVTVISCKDGWTPTSHIRYSKSYKKDTEFTDIFEDIISTFESHGIIRSDTGILLGEVNPPWAVPADTKVKKSWSYSGFLRGALDKLCDQFNLTYQIEHSTLFIYPKDYTEMFTEVELNEDLIVSIRKSSKSNNKTANSASGASGLEITTLLIPKITPKYRVRIKSGNSNLEGFTIKEYEGDYKITGVTHRLSYEGDGWNTILTCESVEV